MRRRLTHEQKIAREERRMAAHLRELAATYLRGAPPPRSLVDAARRLADVLEARVGERHTPRTGTTTPTLGGALH